MCHLTLDSLVGAVAGAVCSHLIADPQFRGRCLVVTPAVTYKVKKILSRFDIRKIHHKHCAILKKEIRRAVESVLRFYDFERAMVIKVRDEVEKAVGEALTSHADTIVQPENS